MDTHNAASKSGWKERRLIDKTMTVEFIINYYTEIGTNNLFLMKTS